MVCIQNELFCFWKLTLEKHGSTLKSDSCHCQKGGLHTSYQGLPNRQGTCSRRPSTTANHYCQAPGLEEGEWYNSMITNNGDDGSVVRTRSLLPQFLGPVLVQTLTQELSALWIYGYPTPSPFPSVSPYTQLQWQCLCWWIVYHQQRNIKTESLRFTIERGRQLEKGFWSSKHRARGMAPHRTGAWEDWLLRNSQIRKPNETKTHNKAFERGREMEPLTKTS